MPKTEERDLTTDPVPFTPKETLGALLDGHRRLGAPIRSAFVQASKTDGGAPGPLHHFVQDRQRFALNLYLLVHQLARGAPWDAGAYAAEVWARALAGERQPTDGTVSRAWRYLRELKMVRVERGAVVRPYLLLEDGTGREYERSRSYFVLPKAYFLEGHHLELSLAGTATLLACFRARRQHDWFQLPIERASAWYGISVDTLHRGIRELEEHQLVEREVRPVPNAKARFGVTRISEVRLTGVYARSASSEAAL